MCVCVHVCVHVYVCVHVCVCVCMCELPVQVGGCACVASWGDWFHTDCSRGDHSFVNREPHNHCTCNIISTTHRSKGESSYM